jgi:ribosome-associated toxin RatA of RatAB toxin-antitoxin module
MLMGGAIGAGILAAGCSVVFTRHVAEIAKSVLVQYRPEQMFTLVDAIERYPEFLPWCGGSSVAYRDEQRTLATILIRYRGMQHAFTTDNQKEPPQRIRMTLVEGPFKTLDGAWTFVPLAEAGCRVELRLRYEFSSRILERLVGGVFGYIADTMVDTFVRRSRAVYGA